MSNVGAQSHETRTSLLIGGLVAILIILVGSVLALGQRTEYTAEAVVVLLPDTELEVSVSAAYYETLSRGQIVATFAEVADNLRFEQQAETRLGLTADQREKATTEVTVVPGTSVILVRSSAESPSLSEQLVDETAALATEYLGGLSEPYRADVVQGAEGSAYRSSMSPLLLLGLAAVAGTIAGLAVQQALYHLLTAVRRGRRTGTSDAGNAAGEASAVRSGGSAAASRGEDWN